MRARVILSAGMHSSLCISSTANSPTWTSLTLARPLKGGFATWLCPTICAHEDSINKGAYSLSITRWDGMLKCKVCLLKAIGYKTQWKSWFSPMFTDFVKDLGVGKEGFVVGSFICCILMCFKTLSFLCKCIVHCRYCALCIVDCRLAMDIVHCGTQAGVNRLEFRAWRSIFCFLKTSDCIVHCAPTVDEYSAFCA